MQHNPSIERIQRLLDSAVWLGSGHAAAAAAAASAPPANANATDDANATNDDEEDEIITTERAKLRPRAPTRTPGPLPRPRFRRADTLVRLKLHQQMAREVLQVVGTREAHTTQPMTVIQRALAKTVAGG